MRLFMLGSALSFSAAAAHATIAVTDLHSSGQLHATSLYAAATAANPVFATLMVVCLLMVWGAYALAAAGRIAPLPMMPQAIAAITALYLVRGLFLVPQLMGYNVFTAGDPVSPADLIFSAVVLVIGMVHAAGVVQKPD